MSASPPSAYWFVSFSSSCQINSSPPPLPPPPHLKRNSFVFFTTFSVEYSRPHFQKSAQLRGEAGTIAGVHPDAVQASLSVMPGHPSGSQKIRRSNVVSSDCVSRERFGFTDMAQTDRRCRDHVTEVQCQYNPTKVKIRLKDSISIKKIAFVTPILSFSFLLYVYTFFYSKKNFISLFHFFSNFFEFLKCFEIFFRNFLEFFLKFFFRSILVFFLDFFLCFFLGLLYTVEMFGKVLHIRVGRAHRRRGRQGRHPPFPGHCEEAVGWNVELGAPASGENGPRAFEYRHSTQ